MYTLKVENENHNVLELSGNFSQLTKLFHVHECFDTAISKENAGETRMWKSEVVFLYSRKKYPRFKS